MIYIFSDGYQDQFGGEKNKKFMISRLKKTSCTMPILLKTEFDMERQSRTN